MPVDRSYWRLTSEQNRVMGFRRDGSADREHHRWCSVHAEELLSTGVPASVWESWVSWERFLFDEPNETDLTGLTDEQVAVLRDLVLDRDLTATDLSPLLHRLNVRVQSMWHRPHVVIDQRVRRVGWRSIR